MRVSSTMMTANYMKNLNRSSQRKNALMEQGDGSSLHRASDNPVQYARTLRYNNNYVENNQYSQNVSDGVSFMKTSEAAMTSIADIIKSIKEKAEGAANGTNTESDVAAVGKEVQSMIEEIVTISNTQLGNRYVFSGQRDKVQPYEIGTERLDKADVKTLDATQQSVFSHYEHDSAGNIVNNASGNPIQQNVQQMLTMKDTDGNSYYVDSTNGNIYTKEYVDSGYKSTLEQNKGLSGDELYQKVAENAVGKFETTANITLTAEDGKTVTDDKSGINVNKSGSDITAIDPSTGLTVSTVGGLTTVKQEILDSDKNKITAITTGTNTSLLAQANSTVNLNNIGVNSNVNISLSDSTTTGLTATNNEGLNINKDIGGNITITQSFTDSAGNSITITGNAGGITAVDSSGNPITGPFANGTTVAINGNDVVINDGSSLNVTKFEINVTNASVNKEVTNSSNVQIESSSMALSGQNVVYSDQSPITYTVTDSSGNPVTVSPTGELPNGTQITNAGGTLSVKDYSTGDTTALTPDAGNASAYTEVIDMNGVQLSSTNMTTTANGVSVDYKADFNNLFTKNDGTSQKAVFTVSGQVEDSDNSFTVNINGTDTDLSFSTSLKTVAYYFGDNNKISMTTINGEDTPRSDSVNVNGVDLFGTDLFGNSGTSVLDDLYSVYDHLAAGDSSWISSDGLTLIDNAHETVLSANTSMGSRSATYQDMELMLDSKGTIITSDITDASGTDVAALAVALTTASTVYNMSLALGSKILPQSLADYI